MRKIIVLFLFLFVSSYSQTIEKRAIYKIRYYNTDNNKFYEDAIKKQDGLEFFLDFNKIDSQFYINKAMELPGEKLNLAVVLSDSKNTIFTSLNTKKITSQPDQSRVIGHKEFIITEDVFSNWAITNENKIIDGLKCFKATRTTKTPHSNPKFKKEYTQIAWFCPEIPFSFGPTYSSGLPGLVVEFHDNNKFFYLKRILDLKEKFKFKQPKKGIKVTISGFNDTIGIRAKQRMKIIENYKKEQENNKNR